MTAIKQVLDGKIYLSEDMQARMIERYTGSGSDNEGDLVESLSDREFEVFRMIGEGLDTKGIADRLSLSIKTIETYKSHLKTKLKLGSSTELIQRAVEWNLLER
ncbi:MAG TPA: response regulator transcription factor [Sediminispirochaeta sp.]|nr:response regulator transcription factor [Sediminispirochaeta sp.]